MATFDITFGSKMAKLSWILHFISLVFITMAVFSTYWRSTGGSHEGLWTRCLNDRCHPFYNTDTLKARVTQGVDKWFQMVQVLSVVAFIFSLGACVIGFLHACVPPVSSKMSAKCSCFLSLISGVCLFIGIPMFSTKTRNIFNLDLSWSFGLVIAGCIIQLFGGVLLINEGRTEKIEQL